MKRIFIIACLCMAAIAAGAQSMKVVVDNKGNVVGRYVATKANAYTVEVQDVCDVPKAGHKVVTFKAEDGQGVVCRNLDRTGRINVRKAPSKSSAVVAQIPDDGALPEPYPCLGKTNGWYKIRINGKVGYVREDMATWDGMCTF